MAILNAARELGWEFSDCATITESEPPLVPEVIRVFCTAQLPNPRRKRAPKKPVPVDA